MPAAVSDIAARLATGSAFIADGVGGEPCSNYNFLTYLYVMHTIILISAAWFSRHC